MSTHTLGTTSSTALTAVTFNPPLGVGQAAVSGLLSPADLATVNAGIFPDTYATTTGGGVLTTGTTHTSTTVDSIASMTRIQPGMLVAGVGIVPGTFVASVNVAGSSIVLSQAATASAAGVHLIFLPPSTSQVRLDFNGTLDIPGRGKLKVFPGDVVAVGNAGEVILVPAAAIAYAGSLWSLSA